MYEPTHFQSSCRALNRVLVVKDIIHGSTLAERQLPYAPLPLARKRDQMCRYKIWHREQGSLKKKTIFIMSLSADEASTQEEWMTTATTQVCSLVVYVSADTAHCLDTHTHIPMQMDELYQRFAVIRIKTGLKRGKMLQHNGPIHHMRGATRVDHLRATI